MTGLLKGPTVGSVGIAGARSVPHQSVLCHLGLSEASFRAMAFTQSWETAGWLHVVNRNRTVPSLDGMGEKGRECLNGASRDVSDNVSVCNPG